MSQPHLEESFPGPMGYSPESVDGCETSIHVVSPTRHNGSIRRYGASARRGALTVEFAITLGLAFFFFFAAFEFCRVYMIGHTAENAIYEGARAGIVPGATSNEVESRTREILNTIGVRNVSVNVTPNTLLNDTPELTVAVDIPVDQNLFSPVRFFRGAVLTRSFTMRREIANN